MPAAKALGTAAPTPLRDPSWRRGGLAGPADGRGPRGVPKAHWQVESGAVIHAAPIIVPDRRGRAIAYVGNHAGRFVGVVAEGEDEGEVALDLFLGGMVWTAAAAGPDGRLYVGADDDHLYAIDPRSNAIAWRLRLGNCHPPRAPGPEGTRCDVDGGPTVAEDGDLFVGADGLYRIGPQGTIRWHYPPEEDERARHVYSTPMLIDDALVVFGSQDGTITALDPSGALVWRVEVGPDVDGSPARGIDGTIVVGADDGIVRGLRPDGTLAWTYNTGDDVRSGIAVGDRGSLFVTSMDGMLHVLDPAGAARFVVPTHGPIATTPVLDADGVAYFGGRDDRLYAVASDGRVHWSVELPADIDASVAIAPRGTLVVGCDDGILRGLR